MDFWAWLRSVLTPKPAAPVQPVAPVSGTTVLTLAPAGAALGVNWLRGEPFTGRTVKSVAYKNDPLNNGVANAVDGVAKLDAALHANTGSVVVVAHSMGAQVACKWLRERPTSDVDPARVEFILTGNPERKGTGVMRNASKPWWVVAQFGGPGLPDDTRYKVRDIARRGDFWADFPHCANWLVGMAAHGDYTQVGLAAATTDLVEGNVSYLSAP